MRHGLAIAAIVFSLGLSAACSQTMDGTPSTGMAGGTSNRNADPVDERACLTAVANETKNTVVVISSQFSQAQSEVIIGVGSPPALWKCLVSRGQVSDVISLADEGAA